MVEISGQRIAGWYQAPPGDTVLYRFWDADDWTNRVKNTGSEFVSEPAADLD